MVERHIVRILEWAGTYKLILYSPRTSAKRRYDLSATFIHSVLRASRFDSLSSGAEEAADSDAQLDRLQVHRILTGCHKTRALQPVVSYLLQYGARKPTWKTQSLTDNAEALLDPSHRQTHLGKPDAS